MTDIVKPLRARSLKLSMHDYDWKLLVDAIDEIEQGRKKESAYLCEIEELQAQRDKQFLEIQKLKATLKDIADMRYTNTSASTIAYRALSGDTSDASDSDFGSERRRYVTFK